MDTLFLGSGASVFAFLGESKLNLIAGIALLAVALWSLVAIVCAFAAPPKRRSVRFGLFTALNVIFSVAGLVYTAVVALEKAGVIAVASSIPADNAFLRAIVDLITLGADRAVFGYALYAATALAVIAFIVTLARARRPQFVTPVAKAKDDGYVLVDDGAEPETPEVSETESESATTPTDEEKATDYAPTEPVEQTEPEPTVIEEKPEEPIEEERTEEPELNGNPTEERSVEPETEEETAPEAEQETGPGETETPEITDTPDTDENEVDDTDDDEPAVPISVARKRIADMGSVLGRLDDLFDNSAFDPEKAVYAARTEEKPVSSVPEIKEEELEPEKDNSDPDSVENILGRILASTRKKVKPVSPVAKPIEKKPADKPKKTVKPEPEIEVEHAISAAADEQKPVSDQTHVVPEIPAIVVEEKVRDEAAIAKTERKRAGRVRTIGRAAELFDEYLSAQSDEDKKKLAESIDCIVVDKDKK